jgi:hypothetical protein
MTKKSAAALGALLCTLVLTGCATSGTRALLDEPQAAEDALPDVSSLEDGGSIELVPSTSRLLGEAEGARFWAARDQLGDFCILSMPLDAPEEQVIGCSGGDGDGLGLSGQGVPTVSWHADGAPEGTEGDTVLRGHLLVRAPHTSGGSR